MYLSPGCGEPTQGPALEAGSQCCPQHWSVRAQWNEGRLHHADLSFNSPPIPAPLHDGVSSYIAPCVGDASRWWQSCGRGAGSPGTRLRHLKPPNARAGRGCSALHRGSAGNHASHPARLEERQMKKDMVNLLLTWQQKRSIFLAAFLARGQEEESLNFSKAPVNAGTSAGSSLSLGCLLCAANPCMLGW